MTPTLRLTLLLLISAHLFACNRPRKQTSQINKLDTFIDSLKLKSNKARILFYADFLKSKIELTDRLFIDTKSGLDTIFLLIGKQKNDTCLLDGSIIPDGEIDFYEDSILLAGIQFVLSDICKGFYSDFTKTPKKYHLTFLGDTILLNLKKKMFDKTKYR